MLSFIRRRGPDPRVVEAVPQDVFDELLEASRLLMPTDDVTAWLVRVTRNRVIEFSRRGKHGSLGETPMAEKDAEMRALEEVLFSLGAMP